MILFLIFVLVFRFLMLIVLICFVVLLLRMLLSVFLRVFVVLEDSEFVMFSLLFSGVEIVSMFLLLFVVMGLCIVD